VAAIQAGRAREVAAGLSAGSARTPRKTRQWVGPIGAVGFAWGSAWGGGPAGLRARCEIACGTPETLVMRPR
jgi:hypothetical protein